MITPRAQRFATLLSCVASLVVVACGSASEDPSNSGTDGTGGADGAGGSYAEQAWPWFDSYESPGCSGDLATCSTFTDARDGREYRQVTVGSQTWMAESLDFGTFVPFGEEFTGSETPKFCPLDDEELCDRLGGMYHWNVAMALPESCAQEDCTDLVSSPHRGICPEGFHIPTTEEWSVLLDAIGTSSGTECDTGTALKSTEGWTFGRYALNGDDRAGMSVFPLDLVKFDGTYSAGNAIFWAADTEPTHQTLLVSASDCAEVQTATAAAPFGIRCLRD